MPLDRSLIIAQAKLFHLGLKTECDNSSGWFHKFKKRRCLRILSIYRDKVSANNGSAESFCEEFSNIISDGQYSLGLVYNADETRLFWKYLARKTYLTAKESAPSSIKDCKEQFTVHAGIHKCKLLIIGKSNKPQALKKMIILPVIDRSNKHA